MKSKAAATLLATTILMAMPAAGEYVTAMSGLVIRDGPGTEFEQVGLLGFSDEVDGEITDGWMKIENGYVSADYLSSEDPLDECQYLGNWRVTAYASTGCKTASGTWPEVGCTLATNDLPFGALVFVRGYGTWRVEDRGPQSMGSAWCDLFLGDTDTCISFGEKRLEIYLLSK